MVPFPGALQAGSSRVRVLVVRTDEEMMIARRAARLLPAFASRR